MNIDPLTLRQVSVFQNATDDDLKLIAGHSIERAFVGVDSNSATDFIDNERPSPGFGYEPAVQSKPQESRSIRIIGPLAALNLMLSGRSVSAKEALAC